ncbi:ABC transporter permease [Mediterraneibacter massiliensis]|uniref:ABC transporter permease n=1 Tax=Mediterraneibacter massiliensis TaxID=1720300 RepID=UPI0024AD7521|nr:ABC transporter permease [Mediterraneibacter massiliensis]
MENPANMENAVYILRKKAKRKKRITILCGIISIAVFLCVWQLLCSLKIVSGDVLASPLQVIDAIITKIGDPRPDGNTLIENILSSFKLAMIGFFLALIVGLPLGLLMGWYRPLDKFIKPIFELIRPLPPIAWIPIVIVLLGIGTVAKSFIIFFTTFVPIVINSYTGIRETNQVYINYAKTCGYSNWRIFLTIGIPSAMPLSFAGMVIALGNGWGTLIAAEMLASSSGLGLTFGLSKIENYVLKWRINTK